MDLWFSENHTRNVKLSIKVEEQIYSDKSDYQKIDVFKTPEFGKILVLDDVIMLTEKDEFIYHEMITHIAMATNPDIKNVLVIGAGDGGTVSQLIKYPTIESIIVAEIDQMVVEASMKFFKIGKSFIDERVELVYEDGLKTVRKYENEFDLIIVDSTDPFGPGEGLFTREFYGNCQKALNEKGILINQHESPFYKEDQNGMKRAHKRLNQVFEIAKVYQAHIPTYPSGHWLFGFASKTMEPIFNKKWYDFNIETKYYNEEIHSGSFMLPNYVKKLLLDAENE